MILSVDEIEKRIAESYELPNNVLEKVPQPMVSIRTSTYNHGPYIRQCIEGVLMQKTNFSFEFIIGEDYSTDETRDIVFEYAKKYPDVIRVITADYNVGTKANGRRCIRACRGKYMAICEGDDYWIDPLKLQKQVDLMESNPQYGMCYAQVKSYYQNNREFGEIRGENFISFENLLTKNTIPSLTCLIKISLSKKYMEDVNPSAQNWKMGDYPMWLWFAHESSIAFIPEVVGVYRILDKSACHSLSPINKVQFIVNTYEIRSFFAERFASPRLPQILDKIFWWNYILAILKNDKKELNVYVEKLKKSSQLSLVQKFILYVGQLNIFLASFLITNYLKKR